jgi:biofilm protein TabA
MIVDRVCNVTNYTQLGGRLAAGLIFLKSHDLAGYEPGVYEIDGRQLYFTIQAYTTRPANEMDFENHRKYIDIQCMLDGQEKVEVSAASALSLTEEYADEKDMEFYSGNGCSTSVSLTQGYILVIYPGEAHKPCIQYNQTQKCKKVIIKVKVD